MPYLSPCIPKALRMLTSRLLAMIKPKSRLRRFVHAVNHREAPVFSGSCRRRGDPGVVRRVRDVQFLGKSSDALLENRGTFRVLDSVSVTGRVIA